MAFLISQKHHRKPALWRGYVIQFSPDGGVSSHAAGMRFQADELCQLYGLLRSLLEGPWESHVLPECPKCDGAGEIVTWVAPTQCRRSPCEDCPRCFACNEPLYDPPGGVFRHPYEGLACGDCAAEYQA